MDTLPDEHAVRGQPVHTGGIIYTLRNVARYVGSRTRHAVHKRSGPLSESASNRIVALVLATLAAVAFSVRMFSIVRFEAIIHEFDPWFNYRATERLVAHGWHAFANWFDELAWVPLGRVVGATVYPGLMLTAAAMHWVAARALALDVSVSLVCVLTGPLFSGLTVLATYGVAREIDGGRRGTGMLAAAFVAVCPGYIMRSVAGSYDNEAVAITALMACFWAWLRAARTGTVRAAALAAGLYAYMASAWGGYVYIANLVPLHVLALLVLGRFTWRLYGAYGVFYVLGQAGAMAVPFVGLAPVRSSEHLAALGVFGLVQLCALNALLRGVVPESRAGRRAYRSVVSAAGLAIATAGSVLAALTPLRRLFAPFAGRFYALWDTGYAARSLPIVASVSEHQPTVWSSFFFDLHLLLAAAPAGLLLCLRRRTDADVFAAAFVLTAAYFAAVMVRLMLTLAPVMCVLGAVSISRVLSSSECGARTNADPARESPKKAPLGAARLVAAAATLYMLVRFARHCTWAARHAYSSPSIILATAGSGAGETKSLVDDFREAYAWLRANTPPTAPVLAWWDYGYQIAGMADRPTVVDNNTWNNTHIATAALALTLPEERAWPVLRTLTAAYVLVLSGAAIGYVGDDLNKMAWMLRIAEGVYPDRVRERDYYAPGTGELRTDPDVAAPALRASVLYRMALRDVGRMIPEDRARAGAKLPRAEDCALRSLVEAYSTTNGIVRIYRVRQADVLGRSFFARSQAAPVM